MNITEFSKSNQSKQTSKSSFIFILLFGIATIILWQFPFGNYILYPFTILGTWFHEMGHGLAAMLLGGNFHRLEIYPNGSGIAKYSGVLFSGNIGNALVAASGPLGPLAFGFVMLVSSKNPRATTWLLLLMGILMLTSVIFWVRSLFGIGFILMFSIICIYIAIKGMPSLQTATIQFLGVQAYTSVYLSTGYLLSEGGTLSGRQMLSDTAQIANNLFLPYWFWGGAIIAISIIVIIYSLILVLKK